MITFVMLARQIILRRSLPAKLTPLFQYSCKLFVAPKKVNCFGIRQIQSLLQNTRVGVYLARLLRLCITIPHRFFSPLFSWSYKSPFWQLLCFHIYTKPRGCGDLCELR